MEEIKEYKLRQILEGLISAYCENERKLGELARLTYTNNPKIEELYYYVTKGTDRLPELMLKYIEEKSFLKSAIEKILEVLRLDFKPRSSILCAINNNGEYVIEDGTHSYGIPSDKRAEFKSIATDILKGEFANNISQDHLWLPDKSMALYMWPGAFNLQIIYGFPKNLTATYQSHNSNLSINPNGLSEEELDHIISDYMLSSEYFNEYQRKIIESGSDTIAVNIVDKALEEAHKRIRSRK